MFTVLVGVIVRMNFSSTGDDMSQLHPALPLIVRQALKVAKQVIADGRR